MDVSNVNATRPRGYEGGKDYKDHGGKDSKSKKKGKGKDTKGKDGKTGKGPGGTQQVKFEGHCSNPSCGKWGHKFAQCRSQGGGAYKPTLNITDGPQDQRQQQQQQQQQQEQQLH